MILSHNIFRLFVILGVFLFHTYPIFGQEHINSDGREELVVGANAHYGWVIIHHASFRNLIHDHSRALEINIGNQTLHKNTWNEYYRYPTIGVSYYYADIGNPEQLGYVHALYSWINFPLVRKGGYTMGFRLGAGLGYITKKFERVENYKNEVIGSHVNGVIHLNYTNNFRLNNHLSFNTNIGITHLSNGAFKTPNLGINIATLSMGFSYRFAKDTLHFPKHRERLPFTEKKFHYSLLYTCGEKEIVPPDHQKYFVYGLSALCLRQMGYKSSLGLGVDYFHDNSLGPLLANDSNFVGKTYHIGRFGVYAAHELAIAKVHVVMDLGYYFISDYKDSGKVYNRIGLKYFFLPNVCANITLKTHYAKADFLEMGFGYKFK